jgi:diguanylate cyclase (GGDEF)-like protein/PAS domain S-box-containing protein
MSVKRGPGVAPPQLTTLLDASPDAVVVVDRSGTIVALNARLEQLFGYPAGVLSGRQIETLLPVRYRHGHAAVRAAYSESPTVRPMSARGDLTGLRADGTEFPVEIALTPVPGSPEGLVMGVVHEAATRRRLSAALAESARTAGALDAIADAIVTTGADGRVEFLNRSAEALTGWERETARGRSLLEVLPVRHEGDAEPLDRMVARCLASGLQGTACEATLPAATGEPRMLDISITPIHQEAGRVAGAAVVVRDVTHARLIARQLSHQATHDALTGLVNRREFERRLGRALTSAAEEHAEHALCFLDLDGFKQVNDTCGHQAGDELLKQLSEVMREGMRSRDTLGRLGGDEFGLLLEHCRLTTARRIAEEIRVAIERYRFAVDGRSYTVGVSIGIVPIRSGGALPGELLRAADTACYEAKRRGGNRVQVDDQPGPFPEGAGG